MDFLQLKGYIPQDIITIDLFIYKFVIYILLSNRAGAIGANALPRVREVIIGSGGQV